MKPSLAVLLAALSVASCTRTDEAASRRKDEAALLKRQIQGLQALVSAAESGTLVSSGHLVIGLGESLFRDLLNGGLPRERAIGRGFTIRADSAQVLFRSSLALVRVEGRISWTEDPDSYADLTLNGGLEGFEIDEESGRLGARAVLYGFEVTRVSARGSQSGVLRAAAQDFARLGTLEGLLPPLRVPVRLEREIVVRSFGEGPVSGRPGSLPLHLAISRVVAIDGRLWVLLDASAGPFKRLQERAG